MQKDEKAGVDSLDHVARNLIDPKAVGKSPPYFVELFKHVSLGGRFLQERKCGSQTDR